MKNCGDMVHMHVAEKGVIHEMVRIAKKKVKVFFNIGVLGKVSSISLSNLRYLLML